MLVHLDKVVLKDNSRANSHDGIAELMQSLKDIGQLQNVVVRSTSKKDKYELVAGFRRFAAAKKLGWKTIEANVLDDVEDQETLLVNLTENLQRIDVPQFDVGRYVSMLKEKYDMSTSEIAAKIGKSVFYVNSALSSYRGLPEEFTKKVCVRTNTRSAKKGFIPAAYANLVINAAKRKGLSKDEKTTLLRAASKDGMTVNKMSLACRLIGQGTDVAQALVLAEKAKTYSFSLLLPTSEVKRLQNKYEVQNITTVFRRILSGKIKETVETL